MQCHACEGMHGEDAQNCELCHGTGEYRLIIEISAPDPEFDPEDNMCDICFSQLDDSAKKVSITINTTHQNNLYVHAECGKDDTDLATAIKQELAFVHDLDFSKMEVYD